MNRFLSTQLSGSGKLPQPNRLVLIFLLLLIPLHGQAEEYGFTRLPGDLVRDLGAIPSRENGWWLLGGAGLTALIYQFEDPEGAQRKLDQPGIDQMVDLGNIWGDMVVQVPLALGCWGLGGVLDHRETAGFGYDLTRSLLISYGVTGAIKTTVSRTRPNGADLSFPSGHTASSFCAAGVLTRRYGGWRGYVGVGLGVLTALGRMEDRKHFGSDVAAGAAIGWIIGRTVARNSCTDGFSLQLVPLGNGLAVTGSF